LYLRQHLQRELAARSRFGRHKERGGTPGPILVHRPLHGHFGHAKSAANLALGGTAIDHQLTGKEAEGPQIVLGVGKNGQMPIEVSHLAVVTLEGQIVIQMRGPRRKEGQLHLRHKDGFTGSHHALPAKTGPTQFLAARKTTLTGQEV
jgi:hypothetical protein